MGNVFNFVLSEELLEKSKGIGRGVIFRAERVDTDSYIVTWRDKNFDRHSVPYTVSQVDDAIANGIWELVNNEI